jgi:hypothetical protein
MPNTVMKAYPAPRAMQSLSRLGVTYWVKDGMPEVASVSICRYQGVVAWYATKGARRFSLPHHGKPYLPPMA